MYIIQGSYTFWSMDFQDFKPNFHDQTEISVLTWKNVAYWERTPAYIWSVFL